MKHCCDDGLSVTKQEDNASGFFCIYELLVRNVDMSHDNEGVYWWKWIQFQSGVRVYLNFLPFVLPYYHKRKKEQRKVRNLKTAIKKLGAEAMVGDQDAIKALNIYLTVSFLSDTNADIEALVIQGRELLDQVKKLPAKTDGTYDEAITKAKLLLNQIS